MSTPFRVDLSKEVAVVTGGGGILCSRMAEALAECGARVAVCDLRQEAAATIRPATQAPIIDGKLDDIWNTATPYKIANAMYEQPKSAAYLSADYKALWDENNLYLLVEVTDDILQHNINSSEWYESDEVEIYIDATDGKSSAYSETPFSA